MGQGGGGCGGRRLPSSSLAVGRPLPAPLPRPRRAAAVCPSAGRTATPQVGATDFEYAALQGGTVKLLGVVKMDQQNKRLSAFVSPCFVPTSNTLASINGATNAVQIASTNLQNTVLVGQGAGRMPTANSCVSDILDIAQGTSCSPFPKQADPELKFVKSFTSSFYVRIRFRDQIGIISSVGQIFSDAGVSIYNLLQARLARREAPPRARRHAPLPLRAAPSPSSLTALRRLCRSSQDADQEPQRLTIRHHDRSRGRLAHQESVRRAGGDRLVPRRHLLHAGAVK